MIVLKRSTVEEMLKGARIPDSEIDGWVTMPSAASAPDAEHRARVPIRYTQVTDKKISYEVHPSWEGSKDLKGKKLSMTGEALRKHREIVAKVADSSKDPIAERRAERAKTADLSPETVDVMNEVRRAARQHYGRPITEEEAIGTQGKRPYRARALDKPENAGYSLRTDPEFEEVDGGKWRLRGGPDMSRPWEVYKWEHENFVSNLPEERKKREDASAIDSAQKWQESPEGNVHRDRQLILETMRKAAAIRNGTEEHPDKTRPVYTPGRVEGDRWVEGKVEDVPYMKGKRPTKWSKDIAAGRMSESEILDLARRVVRGKVDIEDGDWAKYRMQYPLGYMEEQEKELREKKAELAEYVAAHPSPPTWFQSVSEAIERGEKFDVMSAAKLYRDDDVYRKYGDSPVFDELKEVTSKNLLDRSAQDVRRSAKVEMGDEKHVVSFVTGRGTLVTEVPATEAKTEKQAIVVAMRKRREYEEKIPPGVPDYFKEEHPEHAAAMEKVVRVQADDPNSPAMRGYLAGVALFPPKLLHALRDSELNGIYIGNKLFTDMDHMQHYKGAKHLTEAWDTRESWDQVGGCYGHGEIVANALQSGYEVTMAHEIGHAIGDLQRLDDHPELIAAHDRLVDAKKLSPYYERTGKGDAVGRKELLAQGFADLLIQGREATIREYDSRFVRLLQEHLHKYGGPEPEGLRPSEMTPEEYHADARDRILREMRDRSMRSVQESLDKVREEGDARRIEIWEGIVEEEKARPDSVFEENVEEEIKYSHAEWGNAASVEVNMGRVRDDAWVEASKKYLGWLGTGARDPELKKYAQKLRGRL